MQAANAAAAVYTGDGQRQTIIPFIRHKRSESSSPTLLYHHLPPSSKVSHTCGVVIRTDRSLCSCWHVEFLGPHCLVAIVSNSLNKAIFGQNVGALRSQVSLRFSRLHYATRFCQSSEARGWLRLRIYGSWLCGLRTCLVVFRDVSCV